VVICPGGGFYALSINSEGYDVAEWLVKKGVTCFVLKYRLAHTQGTDPTEELNRVMGTKEFETVTSKIIPMAVADGKAAISWVRKHAAEYKLISNRIGVMHGGCFHAL
jgi:acetyl esterase/lipase